MKTVIDDKPVVSIGIKAKPVGFKMVATAAAFETWSDGLYPNKIKAVLRELGTNAIDGTVQKYREKYPDVDINRDIISKLRPFTVHLPTRFEPYFSNRDYGVGLGYSVVPHYGDEADVANTMFSGSLIECNDFITGLDPVEVEANSIQVCDDVSTMYATYFYSNKCQSNDFTGCLGLGSKSPFGYGDSFVVTTWHSGFKRVYNAVISEGFPSIVQIGEPVPMNGHESTGMEIKFAVNQNDIENFRREAEGLYPYFALKPEIIGNTDIDIAPVEYNIQNESWGMRERDDEGPRALMGSIAYPIELKHLQELSDIERNLLNTDIDISFDIGDLKITPSRESLSYKASTITNIKEMLRIIAVDMVKTVDDAFKECKTMWEARCLARSYFYGANSMLSQLTQIVSVNNITWNGNKLGSSEVVIRDYNGLKHKDTEIYEFYRQRKRGSWSGETIVKKRKPESFAPNKDITFVNMDLPKGAISRCMHAMQDQESYPGSIIAIRFLTAESKNWFLELTGMVGTEFIEASSLEKAPSNASTGSRYSNTSQVFKHVDSYSNLRQYDYWSSCEVDLRDGGVYVEMCRYKCGAGDRKNLHPQVVTNLIKQLEAIGEKVSVYGVRSQLVKKFKKSDDWVDLWTYAKNILTDKLVKDNLKIHLANVTEFDGFSHDKWLSVGDCLSQKDKDSPLAKFMDVLDELKKSTKFVSSSKIYKRLADNLGVDIKGECKHDLHKIEKDINSTYELLPLLFYRCNSEPDYKKLINYVRLVDNA